MSTFWVHSSSRARFEQSFGEIADRIRTDACEVGRSDTLQTVSKWLSDGKNGPWLLILDNADDARVLLDLQKDNTARDVAPAKRRLTDYIPQVPHGVVLVTTRDRTSGLALTGDYSTPIKVESMGPLESLELLKGKLTIESRSEAVELVMELEHVPLAISQAGAYIRERAPLMNISKYLAEFRKSQDNQTTLLNSNHADLRRDSEVPNAVITSWQLSFDHVRVTYPKAADLLSLMSFFNRQAIPQFLIQGGYDDLAFCEVMGPLLNFSLVRAENTGQNFELHRLVQIVTRHWLERSSSNRHRIGCAINRMVGLFPTIGNQRQNWATCETLISHVEEVLGTEPGSEQHRMTYASLLTTSSWYLIERKGKYLLAEERSKKALVIQRNILATPYDDLLSTLRVIAYAYTRQARFQEAEELQVEIVEQRIRKGGETDEDTLCAMADLAQTYTTLRKYETAEELLLRVRGLQARLLGHEHPSLLSTDITMAHLKNKQGKFQMAETIILPVLERMTIVFGSENLIAIEARRALIDAYARQEKYVETEKLALENLSTSRRILGERHKETLTAAYNLAFYYRKVGKLVEAEKECRECLGFERETLGPQELATLRTEILLGRILSEQGNFLAASELLANVVNVGREVHGVEQEVIVLALFNYAICVERLGNKREAIRLMTEVVEVRTKLFGADDLDRATAAEWLALWTAAEDGEDASREADMAQNENCR